MRNDLLEIVAEVLEIPAEEVDAEENLMILGLHSLALMAISEKISKKFSCSVSFAKLMEDPTITAWKKLLSC